jgi:hypothetical protein
MKRGLLNDSGNLDAAGEAASQETLLSLYLDTLARTIYELYKYENRPNPH